MPTSYQHAAPRAEEAVRFENMLQRYPVLSDREVDEMITLFPRLKLIDQALMTADDRLSVRLAAFQRDHNKRLTAPMWELIGLLVFPLLAAIFALAWIFA